VGTMEPEALEEEHRDIDTEVAIVRRRTVAQRRGNRSGVMRAATTIHHQTESLLRPPASEEDMEDPLVPRRMMTAHDSSRAPVSDTLDDVSLDEAQEALDAPYTHASPRSGTTLRRAATAAAVSRQRNPPPPTAGRVEYRRADGRAEHPHESDADNWVPPPPPYTKEDPVVDLPSFLRHNPIPGVGLAARSLTTSSDIPPVPPLPNIPPVPPIPSARIPSVNNRPELPRIRTSAREEQPRQVSKSSVVSQRTTRDFGQETDGLATLGSGDFARERDLYHQSADAEDIYDASPVATPSPDDHPASRAQLLSAVTPERERPFGGPQSSSTEYTPASSRSMALGEDVGSSSTRSHEVVFNNPSSSPRGRVLQDEQTRSQVFVERPAVGRLPNASTWPRAPSAPSLTLASTFVGHPHSAPATNMNNEELLAASLPPAPRPEQTMSLHNRRGGTGAPRPASGSIQFSRAPTDDRFDHNRRSRLLSGLPPLRPPSPPEQPLIISTPTGVAGAFDESRASVTNERHGPVLHAPVPRHPRPTPGNPLNQPTVERLETITSVGPRTEPRINSEMFSAPRPSSTPQFSLRHHVSVQRRQSRARRGALKNVQDARERGWTGRKKKKTQEHKAANATGWTDVAAPPDESLIQRREKKCTVM
jgi:hypothetical protein